MSTSRHGESTARPFDLVSVPIRQGIEATDLLRRRNGVGPVLHDNTRDTLSFLVPCGTADRWDLPGSACTHTDGSAAPEFSAGWLVPPHGVTGLTDPERLRAALGEARRTIAAADGSPAAC